MYCMNCIFDYKGPKEGKGGIRSREDSSQGQ